MSEPLEIPGPTLEQAVQEHGQLWFAVLQGQRRDSFPECLAPLFESPSQ